MEKLGVGSLTELVLLAERLGMLAQPASLNEQRPTGAKESPGA